LTSILDLNLVQTGELVFTGAGEIEFDAYKDWFVSWGPGNKIQGRVVRPNIECTNGYIHLVDTVMLDASPPWTVASGAPAAFASSLLGLLASHVLLLYRLPG
jgi:hypothetical protein